MSKRASQVPTRRATGDGQLPLRPALGPREARVADLVIGRPEQARALDLLLGGLAGDVHPLSRSVLIEGLPGTGKTVLLDAAAHAARRAHIVLAHGTASESDLAVPLSSLFRAIGSGPSPVLDDIALEKLRTFAGQDDLRYWLFKQLTGLLQERARARPLLIALDDVHWADELSLLAVEAVSAQLSAHRVGWILAGRPVGDATVAHHVLERLRGDGGTWVSLGPMSDGDLALSALPDTATAATASILAHRSGGNPLLFQYLLGTASERRDARWPDIVRLSDTAACEIADRWLSTLSRPTRAVVEVCSQFTRPFTLCEMWSLFTAGSLDVVNATDEATRAGVLTDTGSQLEFTNDLVRDAISRSLSPARRHVIGLGIGTEVGADTGSVCAIVSGRPGLTHPPPAPATLSARLTQAELRVVRLVADGLTNRQVAERLYISPHTVDSHLRRSFSKLGVNSRVELTKFVALRGVG